MSFFAPNTENYTLGKGVVFFSRQLSPGVYDAERDLGNAPSLALGVDIESLEHFSSRSGIRTKDKEVNVQVSPTVSLTLDEVNADNLALIFLGTTTDTQQLAGPISGNFTILVDPGQGERFYEIPERSVGVQAISYTNIAGGPFTAGESITGGTSGATADVLGDDGSALMLANIASGPFQIGETLTGGTSSATATATTADGFDPTRLFMQNTTQGNALLIKGTDYIVESKVGRVRILSAAAAAVGDVISYQGEALAVNYTRIELFADLQLEGRLRYVSDSSVGTNFDAFFHRVRLQPDGEVAFIGDDWSTLSFSGEILDDSNNNPDTPFGFINVEDEGSAP